MIFTAPMHIDGYKDDTAWKRETRETKKKLYYEKYFA